MEFKTEHIIIIVLVIVVGYLIMKNTSENFNVIEDRWAYPLNNLAGDSWTKEFDRPVYYTNPDGIVNYIPTKPDKIPKSLYKEEIYNGEFEIPKFNYEEMPIPIPQGMSNMEETEANFIKGVSYEQLPESEGQQHYVHLKRQMQIFESPEEQTKMETDNMTETFNDLSYEDAMLAQKQQQQQYQKMLTMQQQNKNGLRIRGNSDNKIFTIILMVIIIVLLYKLYKK